LAPICVTSLTLPTGRHTTDDIRSTRQRSPTSSDSDPKSTWTRGYATPSRGTARTVDGGNRSGHPFLRRDKSIRPRDTWLDLARRDDHSRPTTPKRSTSEGLPLGVAHT